MESKKPPNQTRVPTSGAPGSHLPARRGRGHTCDGEMRTEPLAVFDSPRKSARRPSGAERGREGGRGKMRTCARRSTCRSVATSRGACAPGPIPQPGRSDGHRSPHTRATARSGRWRFGLRKCFHCGPSSQPFTSLKEAVAQNAGWRALERTLEVSGVSSERSLTPINYIFPRESFAQMPTLCRPPHQNEGRNSDRPEA